MGAMVSQITILTIVFSTVYSDTDEEKHQSYASLSFVRGIHRWPVNSLHKETVSRKMFPFDVVIMDQIDATNLRPGSTRLPVYKSHLYVCVFPGDHNAESVSYKRLT